MSTEQQFHPTASLFLENRDMFNMPDMKSEIDLRSVFRTQAEMASKPQEPEIDPAEQTMTGAVYDARQREVIANNSIQVSQNLQDAPKGISLQPTQQSDLCFGIGSVLGITKEALGIHEPDRAPEAPAFAMNNNPSLTADMAYRPRGGMFG